jgi:large subunit ribosomal protein L9
MSKEGVKEHRAKGAVFFEYRCLFGMMLIPNFIIVHMKVILIKDVARLGRRSEVKDVPSGHALNFLIPRKLAIIATPESMKRLSEQVTKHDEQKQHTEQAFEEGVKRLSVETVKYPTDANEQGHLFKGIHQDDIAAHLSTLGLSITKHHVILAHPIKSLGIHEIPLKFGAKEGVFRLEVIKK